MSPFKGESTIKSSQEGHNELLKDKLAEEIAEVLIKEAAPVLVGKNMNEVMGYFSEEFNESKLTLMLANLVESNAGTIRNRIANRIKLSEEELMQGSNLSESKEALVEKIADILTQQAKPVAGNMNMGETKGFVSENYNKEKVIALLNEVVKERIGMIRNRFCNRTNKDKSTQDNIESK